MFGHAILVEGVQYGTASSAVQIAKAQHDLKFVDSDCATRKL